jgi:2-polyprenyl-3-methyl-5-hydroxy-6-metoxy-1,4-benzoquinol methylase
MIQYALLKCSPRLLRWYRTCITLDWDHLKSYLPTQGRLLDVGCGVGAIDYEIARCRPTLEILGIDIDARSIALAQSYHTLPNVEFACLDLQFVQGQFDCILFVDVFHHVPSQEHDALLEACPRLLTNHGYVLIKDVERRGGQISWLMDRYISRAKEVYLHNCDELVREVSRHLRVICSKVHFRFPFPHYYIKAERLSE